MPIRTRPPIVLTLLLLAPLSIVTATQAQTLARPNWVGSGIATSTWWKSSLIYRVDSTNIPNDGLSGITQRLDLLQSLGVDAVWLDPYPSTATTLDKVNQALGTMADLDDFIASASRQKMRVIVDLPASAPPDTMRSIARSWLTRGAAGLYHKGADYGPTLLHDLRQMQSSFALRTVVQTTVLSV